MASIQDHAYLKVCAELASCLTVSIASARRQVELAADREGKRDAQSMKAIAQKLLAKARTLPSAGEAGSVSIQFDQLLEALAEEENFMTED